MRRCREEPCPRSHSWLVQRMVPRTARAEAPRTTAAFWPDARSLRPGGQVMTCLKQVPPGQAGPACMWTPAHSASWPAPTAKLWQSLEALGPISSFGNRDLGSTPPVLSQPKVLLGWALVQQKQHKKFHNFICLIQMNSTFLAQGSPSVP